MCRFFKHRFINIFAKICIHSVPSLLFSLFYHNFVDLTQYYILKMGSIIFVPLDYISFIFYNNNQTYIRFLIDKGGILMGKNQESALHLDYSNEPRRDILCIDIKSFFASVEAVERNQHPLKAMIAVVSKPDNNGGLVLAASPFVKDKYNIRTGSRVYELPKKSNIEIVEPRMALYMEKNLQIIEIFKRYVSIQDLHI